MQPTMSQLSGEPMSVVFRPPALGNTQVPIKLTGGGTLHLTDAGLEVTGKKVASFGRGALFVLALLAAGLVSVLLRNLLDLHSTASSGIGAGLGISIVTYFMRKPAKEGAPMSLSIPWEKVKKVTWDASSECLLIVVKRMRPSGALYVVAPKNSALQKMLEQRIG